MTAQANEILVYKNQQYSLFGSPLNEFIKKNNNLKFREYTTAHYRGYQGYWLLKDNALYLTKLESNNYSIFDLFQTNQPVLAEWYTGQIEFGIGKSIYTSLFDYNETCVVLEIKEGIIVNKKINRYFENETIIDFGKYMGKSINELIYGKIHKNTYISLRDYITCLIEFYRNENYYINHPFILFNQEEKKFISKVKKSGFEYFLTQTFIATSSLSFWENSLEDETANKISVIIEKILKTSFSIFDEIAIRKINDENDHKKIDEKTILINGDIKYLIWAINNVDRFAIPPHIIKKEYTIKYIKEIETNRLNKYIFEYKPNIKIKQFSFSDELIRLNQKKFEKINNVIFDIDDQKYILNLEEKELMEQYGYFLDENYKKVNNFNRSQNNYEISYENQDEFRDNWLSDASGSDDFDTMSDAYWNLD
jgi:hypothetical protein